MFTAVSNVSGLVKESAYLTNLSPGVGWLALTEGPRLQYGHNITNMWVSSRGYGGVVLVRNELPSPTRGYPQCFSHFSVHFLISQ